VVNSLPPIDGDAVVSTCGRYRYLLTRRWGESAPLRFVMLNPSIADASVDDPTIRRCVWFAKREGCGGIEVANLYAFRATKPDDLWRAPDPYGPDNDAALASLAMRATADLMPVVCAWGTQGGRNNRPIALMQQAGAAFLCLGRTKDGFPRHPLYVPGTQRMEDYP